MTSGGGPEMPKSGVFKKAMLQNLWCSKRDNFKFMYFFLSTPGDYGQSKYDTWFQNRLEGPFYKNYARGRAQNLKIWGYLKKQCCESYGF